MLTHWKKILVVIIIAGIFYAGCNTNGILRAEKFFREGNPNLALTPKICYMLSTSAHLTFRYKLAIEIIDRNLKDFPYDPGAIPAEYRRAVAYEKLGEYDKAIQLYEDFVLDHPKDNRVQSVMNKVAKLKAIHQQKF
jgi:tetratricopeptide (TPR) repeat protein